MNIWDIVKNVGTGIFSEVVPGGRAILNVVNEFLPSDSKLSESSTVEDVNVAINSLPDDLQVELAKEQFKVDIKAYETLQTMLASDSTSTHTTRPWIAKWAFVFTAVFSGTIGFVVIALWAYAVAIANTELVKAVVDGWPFVLALIGAVTGTFTILLKAYFGLLSKEHENKIGGSTGNYKPSAIAQVINSIRSK